MTDSLHEQGAAAPVLDPSFSTEIVADGRADAPEAVLAHDVVAEPAAPEGPHPFAELGLAPELVAAVRDLGYTEPTAVQTKVIPMAMAGNGDEDASAAGFVDLMVSSQTGSGKTAAFLLPVLHTLLLQQQREEEEAKAEHARLAAEATARGEAPPKKPRRVNPTQSRNFKAAVPGALVLCPTRELAQQVAHDAIELVRHCRGLRIANVVGGMPYQLQIARLQNANLVVATPGRLLDLQRSMQIKLDQVRFLVVDEADRMLDLGFADDLAEINQLTIQRQQTMMFSATFAPRIQQLAARVMREPRKVQIDSPQQKHANIRQVLHWADHASHKRALLDHWLRDTAIQQAVVFASTQIECDGLANDLQQAGFSAVALHGALSQGLRNRRLMALRNGQVQILVATDVAARGIDVPTISHVFNFGLPMKAEDYTHRIGRTGRAGRDGIAVTFAEFRDQRRIFDIEAFTKQQFQPEVIEGMEPTRRAPTAQPPRGGAGRGRGGPAGRQGDDRRRSPGFAGGGRAQGWGESSGGARHGGQRSQGFDGGARAGGGFGRPQGDDGFGGGHRGRQEGFGGPRSGEGFAGHRGHNEGFGGRGHGEGFGGRGHGEGFGGPRSHGDSRRPAPAARDGRPSGAGRGPGGKSFSGRAFVPRDRG
ncbi:DEAD/DEAH box helicase [uncultured Pseudacidovorax sp.]|uniref:DEAD/DEAH box helicase n=1 Tax=uncultured Pseudacidovorax sp. TaxID=679313 RepID=UPI0025F9746C|nr:DEAD/DEAH box helicase [uncultured Pseudacidovorax sp.]